MYAKALLPSGGGTSGLEMPEVRCLLDPEFHEIINDRKCSWSHKENPHPFRNRWALETPAYS